MRVMIVAAALLTADVGILAPEFLGWGNSSAPGGAAGAEVAGGEAKPPGGESKATDSESARPPLPFVGNNPITGPQNREEVFEFAEKPKAVKRGDKWVITFASKGKCDATVAIVGPDGKIVRHLASGVLGSNAPWPFQQNSLAQSLEWDGKDDRGRLAPAGCEVKVGLGLKPRYGATLAAMDPYALDPVAIACDREGTAYVLTGSFSNNYFDVTIRAFSRDGKYLRTVKPMPGGLAPEKYAGTFELVGPREDPYFVPMSKSAGQPPRSMGMAVSPQGRIVFSSHGNRTHKFLRFLNTDGSGLCRGPQLGPWQCVIGRALAAFSNDGKSVFVSALTKSEIGGRGPVHAVLRFGVDDPTPTEWLRSHNWAGKAPVFAGEIGTPGSDDAHFNDPRGVAVDKDNNVYVCDHGNGRVQVFDGQAKLLRSIKVDRPDQIAVHRKTGAVYVLCPDGGQEGVRLVKFSADGKEACTFKFPGMWPLNNPFSTTMALDDSAEPPIVWLAGAERLGNDSAKGIWRVADKGASFEKLGDI